MLKHEVTNNALRQIIRANWFLLPALDSLIAAILSLERYSALG